MLAENETRTKMLAFALKRAIPRKMLVELYLLLNTVPRSQENATRWVVIVGESIRGEDGKIAI